MKDNFSQQASGYAQYRPTYPVSLFEFILSKVISREAAWDCGTGNGQTAKVLARYFSHVEATDISKHQLEKAVAAPNITYSVQPAEQTKFSDNSFDLITVSQALHWFNLDEFYKEVKRVAKQASWIAVWMYGGISISPSVKEIIRELHVDILGQYWDAERKHVDNNYQTISFPFNEIDCPEFQIQFQWSLSELEGYINTWSALQKFIAKESYNPVDKLIPRIREHWYKEKMPVHFPLFLRMGQIEK